MSNYGWWNKAAGDFSLYLLARPQTEVCATDSIAKGDCSLLSLTAAAVFCRMVWLSEPLPQQAWMELERDRRKSDCPAPF